MLAPVAPPIHSMAMCYYRQPGTAVFKSLRGAILRFFAPQGRHVAPIGVKFGMARPGEIWHGTPNFTPITAGMGAWGPKN